MIIAKARQIFLISTGSFLESLDFFIFVLFSVALQKSFFGEINTASTSYIFGILAIGYLSRIAGAMIYGYIGDKISRVLSFRYSILTISLSSIFIALIPTYDVIGYTAFILLIFFRVMQGVSFGGESSGAIVLIVESTSKHRGFVCGLIMLFISGGVLFANLLYSFISYLFTPSELIDYGWRIAYIITGLTSLITFFARKKLYDSEDFKHSKKVLNLKQSLELVIANKLSFFSAIFCKMGTGVFVGVMIGYLPNYYNTTDKLDTKHLSLFVLLITTGLIIGDIVGGIISDIFSRKSVLITSGIIMAFLSVPMFYFVFSDITIISIMFGVTIILFSLFAGMQDGVSSCFLAENSPLTVRFTFLALTSQIGIALFSGFTPLFSSLLTSYTNVVNVLGFYLAIAFAVQTLAVYLLSKSRVD